MQYQIVTSLLYLHKVFRELGKSRSNIKRQSLEYFNDIKNLWRDRELIFTSCAFPFSLLSSPLVGLSNFMPSFYFIETDWLFA